MRTNNERVIDSCLKRQEAGMVGGGHVRPTITCNPECIYVYEVIYDSSNEGQEP